MESIFRKITESFHQLFIYIKIITSTKRIRYCGTYPKMPSDKNREGPNALSGFQSIETLSQIIPIFLQSFPFVFVAISIFQMRFHARATIV